MSDTCPLCFKRGGRVTDSRYNLAGTIKRRRRVCRCGHRWTTYEFKASMFDALTHVRATLDQYRASQDAAITAIIDGLPELPGDLDLRPRANGEQPGAQPKEPSDG